MVIGEDKSKVSNIVKDNMEHFRILYNNILQECPQVVYKPQQGKLEVRLEFRFKAFLCSFCPLGGARHQDQSRGSSMHNLVLSPASEGGKDCVPVRLSEGGVAYVCRCL